MSKDPNVKVIVGKDENIEKALKKFKKLCEKAGIRKEVRARRYYEKPSEEKRRKARKAERNRRKNTRKFREQKDKHDKKKNRNWIFTHPKLLD
jgi:small subunit ribosomal protein S21